jgi:prepilin-type N-terminal cleavage/methylation domain-containing protein
MVTASRSNERGFTLIELMLAITIGLIVVGMAMGGVPGMIKTSRADGGLAALASSVRSARELSVSARRNMQITFGTNTMMTTRVEYCAPPCAGGATTTLVKTVTLEGRVQFIRVSGLSDTPDAFALGQSAAAALGSLALSSLTPAMFATDGSFVNANGDYLNGTLFIAVPGDPLSARAITIFGPTGAMRLWKWDGRAWVEA